MSQGRAPEQRGSLVGSRLTAWVAAGFLPAIGALFLPVAQASGSDAWLGVAPVAASAHSADNSPCAPAAARSASSP